MQFLSKLFGAGASNFIDSITGAVDKFTLSKEEKNDFKLQMQDKLMELDRLAQETYQTELQSRADIIKAEMAQGDKFTKRARPMIIYVGLIFICLVHVIVPIIAFFTNKMDGLNKLTLPPEFWWAWGTVVSVYGAGRTAEKFGAANKVTQMITGSGAAKAGAAINSMVNNSKNAVG